MTEKQLVFKRKFIPLKDVINGTDKCPLDGNKILFHYRNTGEEHPFSIRCTYCFNDFRFNGTDGYELEEDYLKYKHSKFSELGIKSNKELNDKKTDK